VNQNFPLPKREGGEEKKEEKIGIPTKPEQGISN